ncbi:hypothetical protein QBC34DRAFT_400607 [Podospora aff. communis PSN243]|uniref:BRCT domain-containing protein n=1 Tax=Podospora aff. communis PSN243 TaxID=3040156 RepID=A0AAV9GVQ1_9PEZI|nr:hypothetical protein QBC34DRAFT_400607 [Podospora aff. communis PSN243]
MDQSPPKRITRARAAAKTEPATKSTKVVTAAARAKATRSTASTSAKRKTRSDDVEDSDHDDLEVPATRAAPATAIKTTRATRGRPKKTVEEAAPEPETEAENPAPKTRGRPKKVVVAAVEEPVKATRATRTKKATVEEPEDPAAAKRTTRGRPPSSMAMASRTAARAAVKKTVKFEEPEKENIIPTETTMTKAASKAPETGTGLRAKPVRRPGSATAARATRGTKTAAASGSKPIPLSPKKVNQITLSRADSDDELAPNDKLPARPLRKNPIRPPTGVKKMVLDPHPVVTEEKAQSAPLEAVPTIILGSPAKKMPQSPWKGSIKSPAKRIEGVLGAPAQTASNGEVMQSPLKAPLLQSPAKRPPPGTLEVGNIAAPQLSTSPFKTSLLLSPAKRPLSPMKLFASHMPEETSAQSPAPKATMLATPLPTLKNGGLEDSEQDEQMEMDAADENAGIPGSPTRLRFPGRLSAVLPRHADPALTATMSAVPEGEEDGFANDEADDTEDEIEEVQCLDDPMALDEPQHEDSNEVISRSTTPPASPPKTAGPMFRLREEVLQGYDSEMDGMSEDELAPRRTLFPTAFGAAPSTPSLEASFRTPGSRGANVATGSSTRSTAKRVRMDGKFGFTPLAEQLNGWTAGPSPLKTGIQPESPLVEMQTAATPAPVEPSPLRTTFFDDAMAAQPESADIGDQEEESVPVPQSPVLEDIPLTEEDMALAAEANEMSLLEPEQVEELVGNRSFDDSVSEASQEYGDENEVPIDPTLLGQTAGSQEPGVPLVTPQRTLRREFHTVSKVPLKPADESTPQLRVKKRSQSISRLPVSRPTQNMTRNATVISYSPTKTKDDEMEVTQSERAGSVPPVTPTKSEAAWSMAGTPARTPRRDLDPALLRGAVVFVDVHTSEGADASGIFVELLGQMGARCVSRWSWNPASPPEDDGPSSKIGITHVVYKDGGKRTLEKVRESGGVVQCVGVSWVLDCERENQWLDEAPYYIDTTMTPRGGARRRKSMEPRAIANLNGMLVPTPVRSVSQGSGVKEKKSAPTTPASGRRSSALWIRTPEDKSSDQDGDSDSDHEDTEWNALLTPVPKTPALEAVARYAANLSPATPSDATLYGQDRMDEDDDEDSRRAALLTRTCPPKQAAAPFLELGAGILSREKDESVLLRLMAARRKSLQFAPKIGSPLAKTWK